MHSNVVKRIQFVQIRGVFCPCHFFFLGVTQVCQLVIIIA